MSGPAAQLTITTIDDGLRLAGEVDGRTAPELERGIAERLDVSADLHLDMGGITFMDSSGLRVLLAATDAASGRGGSVELSNLTSPVERLLELSKLRDHFTVRDVS